MFNSLLFEEIFHSLRQNKIRNILTGFGVAWGIFILILLLGAGEGLQQGVYKLFGNFAQNSVWIYGGRSSKIEIGRSEGKQILFSQDLLDLINKKFPEINVLSPEHNIGLNNVIYKNNTGPFSVIGVNHEYFKIKLIHPEKGRFFNQRDVEEQKYVAIIGEQVGKVLFSNINPLGEFININGNFLKVIGVMESGSIFNQGDQSSIFIPITTMKSSLAKIDDFNKFGFTLKTGVKSDKFELIFKKFLAKHLNYDHLDEKAVFIFNFEEQVKSFDKLFNVLKGFLWFIGICFLVSGMVGISNVMLIVVKERTKEIGIRKAIGATPRSILNMILMESIVVTFLSGLIGLASGIGLIQIINLILSYTSDDSDSIFSQLTINMPATVVALILIIITGCLAGLIPAKKAVEILPAKALNYGQM